MTEGIKFGTDGWRALIAQDFSFANVACVARAVAETMQEQLPDRRRMLVGYDRRFLSRQFAETAAAVYAEAGYEVLMGEKFQPTPLLSWCAKTEPGVAGATVITASHNPPEWNGFKFKEIFGGSALLGTTELFEKKVAACKKSCLPSADAFATHLKSGRIQFLDRAEEYFDAVLQQVDVAAIRAFKQPFAVDVMHGAASEYYAALLAKLGLNAEILHAEENPGFRGVAPEPKEQNIPELRRLVQEKKLACGLATDGDADRLAAVDEEGNLFTTQQILSLVYWHMLRNRKKRWSIARSISTTQMVDLVAARAGLNCYQTPVGFKFIAEKMINGEAQIGGEESGGVGFMDHIPERDGLLTGLLLLEIIATHGKGLKAVYDDLCKEERPYYFKRLDLHLTPEQKSVSIDHLKHDPPKEWDGRAVDNLDTMDGYKFNLKDGSWLLIRPSGTEPIFRLYAETESLAASEQMVQKARDFIVHLPA